MKRDDIDFHAVPVAHERLHARLEDWAHWLANTPGPRSSIPMFRLYRSEEGWEPGGAKSSLNVLDCQRIERGVAALPEKHGKALRWSYVFRFSPLKARNWIGCTYEELANLVDDGRQMLLNRRV